jgi:hypothetical protein
VSDRLQLRGTTIRPALLGAVFLAILVIGIWMLAGSPGLGWLVVTIGAVGVGVFLYQLLRRDTLTLDAAGFTIATLGQSRTIPWTDVERFREGTLGFPGVANRAVVWDYRPGAEPRSTAFAKSIAGAQAALPHTFGMKPAELVELLEEWRRRSAGS